MTSKGNQADIIRLLTCHKFKKADLSAKIKKGKKTALHLAASKGNLEACKALVEAGAELLAKTTLKQTALDLVDTSKEGSCELVEVLTLKKKSADSIDAPDASVPAELAAETKKKRKDPPESTAEKTNKADNEENAPSKTKKSKQKGVQLEYDW